MGNNEVLEHIKKKVFQDNEGLWTLCHLKNSRNSSCLTEEKEDLIEMGEGCDELNSDFREQNQNENYKQI